MEIWTPKLLCFYNTSTLPSFPRRKPENFKIKNYLYKHDLSYFLVERESQRDFFFFNSDSFWVVLKLPKATPLISHLLSWIGSIHLHTQAQLQYHVCMWMHRFFIKPHRLLVLISKRFCLIFVIWSNQLLNFHKFSFQIPNNIQGDVRKS